MGLFDWLKSVWHRDPSESKSETASESVATAEDEPDPVSAGDTFQAGILDRKKPLSETDKHAGRLFQDLLEHGKIDLVPVTSAAQDVLNALSGSEADAEKWASIASACPTVSAAALKLANSPSYFLSGPENNTDLTAVLIRMEPGTARRLLYSAVVKSMIVKGMPCEPFSRLTWKHSLLTARLCALLAAQTRLDEDKAYCAGLFHDVGVMGVLAGIRKVKTAVSPRGVLELIDTHAYFFNRRILQEWGLPEDVGCAVEQYRDFTGYEVRHPYAALVALANDLCGHYGLWVEAHPVDFTMHPAMPVLHLTKESLPTGDTILAMAREIDAIA